VEFVIQILKYVIFTGIGILGLGFLIGFHELGHFLFCKLFKISTPSFSIGMGPKIFSKKIGETEFSLSAIPLGGYVEIAGNQEVGQGEQKEALRDDERSFNNKPYYQKLLVMLGGILFNLAFAYFAFIVLYKVGIPKIALLFPEEQQVIIKNVTSGSVAQEAGLMPGDKIEEILYSKNDCIAKEVINNIPEFVGIIKGLPYQKVTLFVKRGDETETINMVLSNLDSDGQPNMGVEFNVSGDLPTLEPRGWLESVKEGISATNYLIAKTVASFKNLISRNGIKRVGGPLLIIKEAVKSAEKGYKMFLILLGLISINLAVLNLIPFPILDGGQIAVVSVESLIRRKLPEKAKTAIHVICWVLILGLMAILTFWDVKRMFI